MLTSKLYGVTDARLAISVDVVGLSYDSSTGVVSLADGYAIPTTTQAGQWDTAYAWGDHSTAGYLPSATAATTYAPIDKGVTGGDTHDHSGGDGAQIDHGGLGGLTDDDHTQYHTAARADTWIAAQKAVANGLATLDAGGKIPVDQLPASVMQYKGVWNASTNTPTLADGTGDTGDIYRVSVAGSQDLGSGVLSFEVGDYAIYNGTTWEKSDTTDAVASVNGLTGVVVLDTDDVDEGETNQYFTDARARASIFNTIAGLDYNSETGVWSLATGYVIPTTDDVAIWNSALQEETDPVVGAVNGIVKANGAGTISAATAGTDYFNASSQIDHDATINFVANEHIDWTSATANLATSGSGTFLAGVGVGVSAPLNPLHVVGTAGTAKTDFIALFAEVGITPVGAHGLSTNTKRAIAVQGDGGAYYLGRDVTNNIEFIIGTSSLGSAFVGATTNHPLQLRTNNVTRWTIDTSGHLKNGNDSRLIYLGTGDDASIQYDGTNLIINPKVVGTGIMDVLGVVQTDGYNATDGTPGETEDVGPLSLTGGGSVTLHFKNGIFVGST